MKLFRKSEKPLTQDEITAWLRELRGNPFVPDSGFDVTTVFRAKLGNDDSYYFAGVNAENPHHRLSTHGEEGAIAAIATALGKKAEIVEGWVMGAPTTLKPGDDHFLANNNVTCCGKCRQQLIGLADPSTVIHSITLNGVQKDTTLGQLIPDAFSFRQFSPELQRTEDTQSAIIPPTAGAVENRLIRQGKMLSEKEIFAWLQELESVDLATKRSQAVVVKLTNGAYVAGVKVEEAAYVSIDPVQSAMAIASGEFGPVKVQEVWSFSKGRDGKELASTSFEPLNLTAVQVLAQFAMQPTIPIHLFSGQGKRMDIKLLDSARYIPTFNQPTTSADPQRFIR